MTTTILLTCEHAVNTIPPEFSHLFAKDTAILDTHRGLDIGAKAIADHLARHLSCSFYQCASVSRLLVDCNRTLSHKTCFSEWSRHLSDKEKEQLKHYYFSFREPVIKTIQMLINQKKRILHFSIHSFTPVLNGKIRETEIGLLYDPKRRLEKNVAAQLQKALRTLMPHYRTRLNYPYLGTSDGFTTSLRTQFDEKDYIGLEIEMNQSLMTSEHTREALMRQLTQAIESLNTDIKL